MSIEKRVALTVAALLLWCAPAGSSRIRGSGGNGNINLEADDPEKTYRSVLEAAGRHGAVVSSYNANKNAETGQTAVSAQFALEKDKVAVFMAEVAALGKVKSQNYYERNADAGQAGTFQAQVETLDQEISTLGSIASRVPTIMGLAVQHRQTLASQLQYAAASGDEGSKVTLSLSIQEAGVSSGGLRKGVKGQQVPLPWALFCLAMTAFLASWMGFLFGRLRSPGAMAH